MTNMFISIILDGYNISNDQEKMRINDETILAFRQIWMKYDPKAEGLIPIPFFKNLVIDLILAEIKIVSDAGGDEDDENVIFNLRWD